MLLLLQQRTGPPYVGSAPKTEILLAETVRRHRRSVAGRGRRMLCRPGCHSACTSGRTNGLPPLLRQRRRPPRCGPGARPIPRRCAAKGSDPPGRWPALPSMSSRRMSACPRWWAVSTHMCTRICCRVTCLRSSGHQGTTPGASSGEFIDGGVAVGRREPVQLSDLLARLAGGCPHVRIRLRVVGKPRQLQLAGTAEDLAKVAEFDAGHVLDQSQQAGSRGREGPAHVVLAEAFELPEEVLPPGAQVGVQDRFVVHDRHYTECGGRCPGGTTGFIKRME